MSAPRTEPVRRRTLSRLLWWGTVAVAAGLVITGAAWTWLPPPAPLAPSTPLRDSSATPQRATLGARTGTDAEPVRAAWVPGAPRRVVLPTLHVAAPVVPVMAADGTLVPPSDPSTLGWWAGGARPGADRGSALIAGHTVHDGPGALNRLEHLRRGDGVAVVTDRGRIRYAVRSVRVFSKGAVERRAERLFDQDAQGRLVLLTCEDWDGERYLSNVVVTAVPVGT